MNPGNGDADQSWPIESELSASAHVAAYSYWKARRPDPLLLPSREDLDPLEMPRTLLPWINLIEVHREGESLRYRHRLVGTGIVEMRQRDGTGRWFEELYDEPRLTRVRNLLEQVVADGRPRMLQDDLGNTGRSYRTLRSLVLPLAADGSTVDMLLAVSHYD